LISWATIAACVALAAAPTADEGDFAPEPPTGPSFRGDFRAAWALTDGSGMLDHAVLEGDFGVQLLPTRLGVPAPTLLFGIAAGIAESAEPSVRVVGGVELPIKIAPMLEIVPAFFGGYLRLFRGDQRQGPMFRGALGLRVLGDDGFFITVEPISVTILPLPPAGAAPYTDHFAWEIALIKIGGRGP
jgi:hypothetical protein